MSENGLCCYSCSRPSAYYDIEPMCNVCLESFEEHKTKLEELQRKLADANAKLGISKEALRFYGNIGEFYSENQTNVHGYGFQEEKGAEEEWGLIDGGDRAREALKQIEGKK